MDQWSFNTTNEEYYDEEQQMKNKKNKCITKKIKVTIINRQQNDKEKINREIEEVIGVGFERRGIWLLSSKKSTWQGSRKNKNKKLYNNKMRT